MRIRRIVGNVIVGIGTIGFSLASCAGDCSSGSKGQPPPPEVITMTPTCGDIGTPVQFLVKSDKASGLESQVLFSGATATGRHEITTDGQPTWALSVAVPAGTVTGPVVAKSDPAIGDVVDFGVFTIPCPGGTDGGGPDGSIPDSGGDASTVTGPTCGVASVGANGGAAASTFGGKIILVPPGGSSPSILDTIADAEAVPTNVPIQRMRKMSARPSRSTTARRRSSTCRRTRRISISVSVEHRRSRSRRP